MSAVRLDWSAAEVREGRLEVELRGEPTREWKDSFERTVALLRGGDWGKVKLKKDRLRVEDVAEGAEDRLHHFLESVVLQANATTEQAEPETPAEPDADEDKLDRRDREMTERFQSFAGRSDD